MNSRMPDVIGLGFRRCATSWLHNCLNHHPRIGKPLSGVHFFSEHSQRDKEWYVHKLAPYADREVLLEFSVSYTYPEFYEQSAARMGVLIPEAKLFLSVRNPIDRAFSDYRRSVYLLELKKDIPFEVAVSENLVFLERGLYAKCLKRYLEFFPQDQILVLYYEDLRKNPAGFLKTLCDFIGISMEIPEWVYKQVEGSANVIRSEGYARLIFSAKEAARSVSGKIGLNQQWGAFTQRYMDIYQALLSLNSHETTLSQKNRRKLRDYYETDIRELEQITSSNLNHWR